MALINCPECGTEISDKATTCIKCGYPIGNKTNLEPPKESTKCPECGKEISDQAAECGNCGYPISEQAAHKTTENITPDEKKYFDEVASDAAYGIRKKSTIKKLMKQGISEEKIVDLLIKVKESPEGRKILVRKHRNQTIIGVIMIIFSFMIISAATAEGGDPPGLLALLVLFGFLFAIRGLFGWIKYKRPQHQNKMFV